MKTCQQSLPVLLFSHYLYFGGFLQFLSKCMSSWYVSPKEKYWFSGIYYTLQIKSILSAIFKQTIHKRL